MNEGKPSQTAYRVALRRAAHQVFDTPVLFHDPLALRILGLRPDSLGDLRAPRRPFSRSLRAYLVARARFAEDSLAQAVPEGTTQYVLLGAGLDTFAYRNPHRSVQVFEVDHPATQAWKLRVLAERGIAVPPSCSHVPVDFERDGLLHRLQAHGFQPGSNTVFAWLGVVPYLSPEAMQVTLSALGALPGEMRLVLDYSLPREMLPHREQLALDSLSARVTQAGEPFRQFFRPEAMEQELGNSGFSLKEDLGVAAINTRYFTGRADGLRVLGTGVRVLLAVKPAATPAT